MPSEIVATVRKLIADDETSQATRLIRGQLFEVSRGRELEAADGLELAIASWRLGLAEETLEWARHVRGVDDDAERIAEARALELAALVTLNRFGQALDVVRAGGTPPPGISEQTLAQLYTQEGLVLWRMGLTEEALRRYTMAEQAVSDTDKEFMARLSLNRGAVLSELGREEEAIAVYERAIAVDPEEQVLFSLHLNMGNSLRSLQRYDEAEQAYIAAARYTHGDNMDRGAVLSNHARVLAARGDRRKAKQMLKDALAMRLPKDPAGAAITAEELAKLLAAENDYHTALKWTATAVDLRRSTGQPDDPDLMELGARLSAVVEVIDERVDVACEILLGRLRAEVPGEWPLITEGQPSAVLQLAASQLEAEAETDADPGRRVEDRWLLAFISRQIAVGYQLALSEYTGFLADLQKEVALVREWLRLEHWIERKRFYEAHQERLESGQVEAVTYVLERHADDAEMPAADLAGLRQLVRSCQDRGIDVAFAELPEEHPNELFNRVIMVGTWRETMAIVQAHPELLEDGRLAILRQASEQASPRNARIDNTLQVLQRCRIVGIARAFAEAPSLGDEPLGAKFDMSTVPVDEATTGSAIDSPVAVSRARAMVHAMAQADNPTLLRLNLILLGEALLSQPADDRAQQLQEALAAYQEAGDVEGAWSQDEVARLSLHMADALLELALTRSGSLEHVHLAARQYSRALDVSPVAFKPARARRAATGLYRAAGQYLASASARSEKLQIRQDRIRACRIAIAATDELLLASASADEATERQGIQWAYDAAVEDLFSLGMYAAALAMVEHSRARGFLVELGRIQRLPAGLPAELAEREAAARDHVRRARVAEDSGALAVAQAELRGVHRDLAQVAPEFARGRAGEPPTAEEVTDFARNLDARTVVLAWYVTPVQGYAFALRGGTGEMLGSRLSCDQGELQEYARLVADDIWQRPAEARQRLSPAWRKLLDAVLPIAWRDLLNGVDEIIVVPHGLLSDLPLHALPIHWLGDRSLLELAPVTYLPGLALVDRLRRTSEGDIGLVLANAAEPKGLPPSEFDREAHAVGRITGSQHVYTGVQARAERLAELGALANLVHIAAHGVYDPADPLGSAVLLSDGVTGVHRFTARDVLGLPVMPGPLVVLSGCETSRQSGDFTGEAEGLVRAFFLIGARAVIAGQWRVDSASTRLLMEAFYTEFQASGNVVGSLRHAALTVKNSDGTGHPYYWAPFVVWGVLAMDDDPIDFGPWTTQSIEFALSAADPADERSAAVETGSFGSEYEPRISLPKSSFDCIALDYLADHPAVDAMARAELASGAIFRLLRFPLSVRPAQETKVDELRFAVRLADDPSGPRVHGIFPQRFTVEQETTTEVAFEPSLSIGSAVDIGFGRVGRSVMVRQARSTMVGFWSEDGAEWVMRPPPGGGDNLEGSWECLIVIHWADGVRPLHVTLSVSATITIARTLTRWRTKRAERVYDGIELTGCISVI